MIVMRDESREVIDEITGPDGRACDLHGRGWTGCPVAEHEDGYIAVLQYVHPDFEQVTEEQIQDFAGEKTCHQCGDPTEPLPVWLAERIIRAYPELVLGGNFRWEGICKACAKAYHDETCQHCKDNPSDDEDTDEDGWMDQTRHYLH